MMFSNEPSPVDDVQQDEQNVSEKLASKELAAFAKQMGGSESNPNQMSEKVQVKKIKLAGGQRAGSGLGPNTGKINLKITPSK